MALLEQRECRSAGSEFIKARLEDDFDLAEFDDKGGKKLQSAQAAQGASPLLVFRREGERSMEARERACGAAIETERKRARGVFRAEKMKKKNSIFLLE